jgi:hypothetical protein
MSFFTYSHTPLTLYPLRGSRNISNILAETFYQNVVTMRNTVNVTGGKPVALWLQSISGARAINPIVAFYDIDGRKREVLLFYLIPDTTREVHIAPNRTTTLIKIVCKSKNNCKNKTKALYFLCHPILNIITIIVNDI